MKRYVLVFSLGFLLLCPLLVAEAQNQLNYVPMTNLPFAANGNVSAEQFVGWMYNIAIVAAGLLAVIKIIYGGVRYMLTDVVPSKEAARKEIFGAIFGLVIVLSAVFILELINPQLKNINLFRGSPSVIINAPAVTQPAPTADASGSFNLSGASQTQRNQVVQQLRTTCPDGNVVVGVDSARCGNPATINQGSAINTTARFQQLSSRFSDPANAEGLYNQFASPHEPAGVTESDINEVVNREGGGNYLFAVNRLDSSDPTSNQAVVRQQQTLLCRSGGGDLFDSANGNFSVCVME